MLCNLLTATAMTSAAVAAELVTAAVTAAALADGSSILSDDVYPTRHSKLKH